MSERMGQRSRVRVIPLPMRRVSWLLAVVVASCGRTRPPEVPVIQATPTVVTPREDEAPTAKFQRARSQLQTGHFAQAAQLFDELTAANVSDEMTQVAGFNAGVAWEQAGDRDQALARFRAVAEHHPAGDAGKWSALRAARIEAYLEHWSQLSALADLLLGRSDLTDIEHLESYGAKALALVEAGDPDAAERFVNKGRDIIEALRLGEGGKLPLEVAQIQFALGEIRKVRSEAITFVPLPPKFAVELERRCQGLLDAQSAYSDAMRSYDAHWAAMSGYRVGELYQRLHRDVLAVPLPKAATTTSKKQLFEGAMRLRYRVLLEKGLQMMEHTVMIGERTGEASAWMDRAREARQQLEAALAEQKAFLTKLPYSEKDLQRALDDLAKPGHS
jgi:tetratricopeptide (TPR) repeat protein